MTTRIIDLEAHYHSSEYMEYLRKKGREDEDPTHSQKSMLDTDEERLEIMDKAGIDIQVLNAGPPSIQEFEASDGTMWSRIINDELSEIVKKYPDRYSGFASIAPQSPDEAAEEVARAVTKLGLKGVCIKSHAKEEYLDDKKYWPIFEQAEKHDVPIFLHPSPPIADMLKPYTTYGPILSGPVLGFGADLSLHVMRLIMSGLFDEYPDLKIILGHMGEGLPFWLSRIDFFSNGDKGVKLNLQKKPSEYIQSNFTVTTSGMCYGPAFLCTYMGLGADSIAFAVDYPHEDNMKTIDFINNLPISPSDKEKVFHLNAEKLLGIS